MRCSRCGSESPDYALFCGRCGTSFADTHAGEHVGAHAKAPSDNHETTPSSGFTIERWESITPTVNTEAKADTKAPSHASVGESANTTSWKDNWKIPLFVLLAILLVAALAIAVPLVREQVSIHSDLHRVTFIMRAPGYNDSATAIPVQVRGTEASGKEYAKTVFLDGGGYGVVLEPGTYTLSFPGGSILANGSVLVAPKTKLEVTVPQGLPRNAFVQVPTDQVVEYTAVAPIDVTEELLGSVFLMADANPADHGKAAELRDNALKAHEDALAQKDEHAAKVQENAGGALTVSVGDIVQFVGTLELCSAEDASARLEDESVVWNYYGRTLAILWLDEEREVELQDPSAQGDGWYDDEGTYHEDEVYTERYRMKCLLLNDDVEGIYSYGEGDDGTLAGLNGKRVLVTGKANTPDWVASQLSPIVVANPTFEEL